jgi:hypothetical protein
MFCQSQGSDLLVATRVRMFRFKAAELRPMFTQLFSVRMYMFPKCYVGFCTPRRTIMDLKKKKKERKGCSGAKSHDKWADALNTVATTDRGQVKVSKHTSNDSNNTSDT